MTILVIGATGALGRPAVRALRERGVAVRALSRHPEAGADLAGLGVEVTAGDLIDAGSIERACTGVDRVLACAHGFLGRGRWRSEAVDWQAHLRLFDIARRRGVQRLVYTSAMAASDTHPIDFFRHKHAVEAGLERTGLEHAILRPSAFMEQHAHEFNGRSVLRTGRARLIGPGTRPRNFVAAGDVAQFAVRALVEDPLPFVRLDIGGPGNHSDLEVATRYAAEAGIPLRVSHLPLPLAGLLARAVTPWHPGVARVLRAATLPGGVVAETFDGAAGLERRFGIALTTLDAFIRARVDEWRRSRTAIP